MTPQSAPQLQGDTTLAALVHTQGDERAAPPRAAKNEGGLRLLHLHPQAQAGHRILCKQGLDSAHSQEGPLSGFLEEWLGQVAKQTGLRQLPEQNSSLSGSREPEARR